MVRPKARTRKKTAQRKRTPGGKLKVYRVAKKKTVRLSCSRCGKPIHGTKTNSSSKTVKRPSRKDPHLCATCSKKKLVKEVLGE